MIYYVWWYQIPRENLKWNHVLHINQEFNSSLQRMQSQSLYSTLICTQFIRCGFGVGFSLFSWKFTWSRSYTNNNNPIGKIYRNKNLDSLFITFLLVICSVTKYFLTEKYKFLSKIEKYADTRVPRKVPEKKNRSHAP